MEEVPANNIKVTFDKWNFTCCIKNAERHKVEPYKYENKNYACIYGEYSLMLSYFLHLIPELETLPVFKNPPQSEFLLCMDCYKEIIEPEFRTINLCGNDRLTQVLLKIKRYGKKAIK